MRSLISSSVNISGRKFEFRPNVHLLSSNERVDASTTVAWSPCQNWLNLFWKGSSPGRRRHYNKTSFNGLVSKILYISDWGPKRHLFENSSLLSSLHIYFFVQFIGSYHSVFNLMTTSMMSSRLFEFN